MQDIYSHSSNEPIVRNSNAGVEPSNTVQHPATSRGTQRTIEQRVFAQREYKQEKKETAIKIVASPPAKRRGEKTMKHFVPLDVKTEKKFFAEDFYV